MPRESRPSTHLGRKRPVHLVNGVEDRTLPDDPRKVAMILRERRHTATPAGKLRAKIAANLKARGAK